MYFQLESQELALFQRYKWLAAVVSVTLTAIPLLWLTSWLETQGEAEVAIAARWSVGMTDLVIGEQFSESLLRRSRQFIDGFLLTPRG